MPRYIEPKDAVGLSLRAVIEGELLHLGLEYQLASQAATVIEARIDAGPSDWLALSDGTTFTKSWVPERRHVHTDDSGTFECPLGSECQSEIDPVRNSIEKIHAAHEERVKANTEKAVARRVVRNIGLELDIVEFERFQASFGASRIFIQ